MSTQQRLKHEKSLQGYHRSIGGSAGRGTFGGPSINRPTNMPRRSDVDVVVRTPGQFANSVQQDNVSIYIDDDATIELNGSIDMGSGVTIVSGYCDPSVPGRGGEIVCGENGHRLLTSKYGEAPSLWGVSFRGPELEYFDPDHTASDFSEKQSTGLFCYDSSGVLEVIGCEFRGWTMAGLEIGARNHETTARVRRSSFHHNLMEHLGYGVELYNGDLSMDRCFLDRCRHGISGFGYSTCSWSLTNSVVGPGPWAGHALDMHKLANNLSDGDETAGGDILVRRCSLMSTDDIGGYGQEAFALRGVPAGEARIDKCHFWHDSKPTETNVQGQAYRQEWDSWKNFYVEDCVFGASNLTDGVGAPRARKANEDDDEPEQEDPSGQPNETMPQLMIHGRGPSGEYRIEVDGDVSPGPTMDKVESINDLGDNRHEITGRISHATDSFELADDATPLSASIDVPARITIDGDDRTAELVGPGASIRFDEQQGQLNHLQAQLDKLRLWAAELGDALSFSAGDDG